MAEEPSRRSPYHEEYIQTGASIYTVKLTAFY